MPVGQEILDVRSSDVHDAKARDVDGAILDHLALPSVVHYLITAKYTGVLVHEGENARGRRCTRLFLFACVTKVACSLIAPVSGFRRSKGTVYSFAKSVRLPTRSLIFRRVFKVDSRTGTRVTVILLRRVITAFPLFPYEKRNRTDVSIPT